VSGGRTIERSLPVSAFERDGGGRGGWDSFHFSCERRQRHHHSMANCSARAGPGQLYDFLIFARAIQDLEAESSSMSAPGNRPGGLPQALSMARNVRGKGPGNPPADHGGLRSRRPPRSFRTGLRQGPGLYYYRPGKPFWFGRGRWRR